MNFQNEAGSSVRFATRWRRHGEFIYHSEYTNHQTNNEAPKCTRLVGKFGKDAHYKNGDHWWAKI